MSVRRVPIADIAEIITKGTTPTTLGREFTESGVNFIKAEALNGDSGLDTSGLSFIDEETHELLGRSILKEDDVLVTIAGAHVGRCGYVTAEHLPANTNQAVGIIRVRRDKAVPRFVYYFFKQPNTFALCQGLGSQSAQPNVNLTILKSIQMRLPSMEIQEKTASILSAYDDLIENNHRRIRLLEQATRLLYKEWFVRLRFPGHEHVEIKDGVPEGWKRVTLSEMCEEIREQVNPSRMEPSTPYIGLEHIPRRSITLGDWGVAGEVGSTKFRFEAGDVLFGKIRPYFHKVGVALTNGITSSDAIVVRPRESALYEYVLFLVSSDEFVALASKTVREGSKMPRADWKFLSAQRFPMPTRDLVTAFASAVRPIVDQLRVLALQNRQLARARDLLLPRLMNGAIVV